MHRTVAGTRSVGRTTPNVRGPGLSRARSRAVSNGAQRRAQPERMRWVHLSDDELLELRFKDLGLVIRGTLLDERIVRLYGELSSRGLKFRPHCWLSTEWFSPDGVPGIGIPFYLGHPRLTELEQRQVLEVEGGTERWCMQLLRHEAGHAIDFAFRLHRRKAWREVFGSYTTPYRESYQPQPYSKSYVQHLDRWYAQSHPAEDWAETFAVWLDPASDWQRRYRGWAAKKKLEYVDQCMTELRGRAPIVRTRERVDQLSSIDQTLAEHYRERRRRYGVDRPLRYDRDLGRLFPVPAPGVRSDSAAAFLRRVRPELRRKVARWTGHYQYTIDRVLLDMIRRSEVLGLRLAREAESAKQDAMVLLAVQSLQHVHAGHHRLAR